MHTAATLGREWVPSFAEVHELIGHGPLADGVVRYVGDPVALVVAETRAQAVDAAELVDVDYDLLDVVVDMEEALAPGAPLQFPEVGSNVAESVRAVHPDGQPATRSPTPRWWCGRGSRTSGSRPRRSRATRSSSTRERTATPSSRRTSRPSTRT